MRVVLGVVFLMLTTGCDPCAGDPTFVDPDGRLDEEEMTELEEAYAAFVAAVGPERVCVDRVEVASTHGAAADDGPAWPVVIDPQTTTLTRDLLFALCEGLDGAEGLTAQAPHLFDEREFASVCADGPRDVDWLAEVEAACEVSPLSELEQFMAHVVYPLAPQGRNDGALASEVGAPLRFPDIYAITEGGPLGAGVLLVTYRDDTYAEQRAVYLDPETGVATEVMSGDTSEVYWEGYAGTDVTVILDRTSDPSFTALGTVHVIDPDTLAVTSVAIESAYGDPAVGTVSEGWLYLMPPLGGEGGLYRIDLATGAVEPIALPALDAGEAELLTGNVVAAPGGVVLYYVEAVVTVEGDFSTMEVEDHVLARWSAADGTWTELMRGLEFEPSGTTTDRRIVGTLSGVDKVLAAYAYENDALTISGDVCMETDGRPDFVAGDRAWHIDNTKTGAVLTPFAL